MYESSDDVFKYNYNYLNTSHGLVNSNLLNGLMLIHPIILYYFYTIYIYINKVNLLMCIEKFTKKPTFKKNHITNTLIVYTAIILGCWWAEQELAWGGWWSWDFVELLALNFLIILSAFTHTNKNTSLWWGAVNSLSILIVSIILVRFNIINSIHNFITVDSQNQYFYYIILIVVFLLIGIQKSATNNIKSFLNPYNYFILLSFIFYVLYTYNLFIKDLFNLKYYYFTNIKHIFTLLTLVYLIFFTSKKINSTKYTTINIVSINLLLLFILFVINLKITLSTTVIILIYIITESVDNKNKLTSIKLNHIHKTLVVLFLLVITQTYIFINPSINYLNYCNITIKTTYSYIFEVIRFDFFTQKDQTSLLNMWLRRNLTNGGSDGYLKHIFSKEIFLKQNTFVELYSYNSQYLYQPVGVYIYILLSSILLYIYQLLRTIRHIHI